MADVLAVRDEYRAQTWAMLLRECKASGMTKKDFCEQRYNGKLQSETE